MYNEVKKTEEKQSPFLSGRAFAGLIVIVVGVLLLARQVGADIPHYILSFGMLLILVGIYVGYRQRFNGWLWIVISAIGTIMLTDKIIDYPLHQYIWPIIIISVGLFLIFRPKAGSSSEWPMTEQRTSEDAIDTVTIFGAVKKNVISKNFKGGEAVTVFGGMDLDLTQADISGRVHLELVHVFGGSKLIIPPDWQIHTDEVVCIFGGIDDKRKAISAGNPDKVLLLSGTCIFGGIDIKSY